MKLASIYLLITCLHLTACAGQADRKPVSPSSSAGSVRTPEQAVEVVRRRIRDSGGDPAREEITAEWRRGEWHALSWHIFYPNNKGASRFVPGGHTYYTISPDGRVTSTRGGK